MEVSQSSKVIDKKPSGPLHVGKPKWLKTKIPTGQTYFDIKKDLRGRKLATVCEEAKCPNIGECWNTRTATFMVMGDTCTRACRFCNVKTGNPGGWLDAEEPTQVAGSCLKMGLKYVVITMVDRDDIGDGGASHVRKVVDEVKKQNPEIVVELLAGDFKGQFSAVEHILDSGLEVYAHNLETVEALSPRVRDRRADYRQSLGVLEHAKSYRPGILTKSALMLGLGESEDQVIQTLKDLRSIDCDMITIGQYMRPSKKHLSIKEWIRPEVFARYERVARELGFRGVVSAPLVRSSYKASEFYENVKGINA